MRLRLYNENDNENLSTSSWQALLPAWRRGDEVICKRGIAIDYSHHHHSVFSWRGQMVENHYVETQPCRFGASRPQDVEIGLESCGEARGNENDDDDENDNGRG